MNKYYGDCTVTMLCTLSLVYVEYVVYVVMTSGDPR